MVDPPSSACGRPAPTLRRWTPSTPFSMARGPGARSCCARCWSRRARCGSRTRPPSASSRWWPGTRAWCTTTAESPCCEPATWPSSAVTSPTPSPTFPRRRRSWWSIPGSGAPHRTVRARRARWTWASGPGATAPPVRRPCWSGSTRCGARSAGACSTHCPTSSRCVIMVGGHRSWRCSPTRSSRTSRGRASSSTAARSAPRRRPAHLVRSGRGRGAVVVAGPRRRRRRPGAVAAAEQPRPPVDGCRTGRRHRHLTLRAGAAVHRARRRAADDVPGRLAARPGRGSAPTNATLRRRPPGGLRQPVRVEHGVQARARGEPRRYSSRACRSAMSTRSFPSARCWVTRTAPAVDPTTVAVSSAL